MGRLLRVALHPSTRRSRRRAQAAEFTASGLCYPELYFSEAGATLIERAAERILAARWDGKLPVDVHAIASRMGLEVRSGALEESGRIELIGQRPRITVNASDAWVRQRFTVAHELGHWTLGHLRHGQRLFRDAPDSFTLAAGGQEREANAFATAILMPADSLRYVMQEGLAETLEGLARMFDVSQAAVYWRVHNLGLFAAL